MTTDTFALERFIQAQDPIYAQVVSELRRGRKRGHWIWYIFPQLRGLGMSPTSQHFGISGLEEARAYLAHPLLGERLAECVEMILSHQGVSAESILGRLDALKFRSCLTLFAAAEPSQTVFAEALERFFGGTRDPLSLELLNLRSGPAA
jgi:uncharacterized protein (DUF1810 family)